MGQAGAGKPKTPNARAQARTRSIYIYLRARIGNFRRTCPSLPQLRIILNCRNAEPGARIDAPPTIGHIDGAMRLNEKQKRFCLEYIIDLNATQAAIRAGYSKNTAGQQGHELLKHPEIEKQIERNMRERSERTKIDADWLLQRLADEAMADIADLYNADGTIKRVDEWPMIWRQGLVQGVEIDEILVGRGEDRQKIGECKKIRLSDRVKRLEMIGRHIGVQAFREQMGLGNPDGTPLDLTARDIIASRLAGQAARETEGGDTGESD